MLEVAFVAIEKMHLKPPFQTLGYSALNSFFELASLHSPLPQTPSRFNNSALIASP